MLVKHLKNFVLIFIFSSCVLSSYCQIKSFHFNQITTDQNLTTQNINFYVYKDTFNYVWISSPSGLNRFDGRTVKQYLSNTNGDKSLKESNILSHFFSDKLGNVWMGTTNGLYKYRYFNDAFEQLKVMWQHQQLSGAFYILFFDITTNQLWFRLNSKLYIAQIEPFKVIKEIGEFPLTIRCRVIKSNYEKQHILLLTSRNGLGLVYINSQGEIVKRKRYLDGFLTTSVACFGKSLMTIGTNKGLILLNPLNGKIEINQSRSYLNNETIIDIVKVDNNRIIFATASNRVFDFNVHDKVFTEIYITESGNKISRFNQPIDKLNISSNKLLWISTSGGGIYYTNLNKKNFHSILENITANPDRSFIKAITEDKKGNLWAFSRAGIVQVISKRNGVNELIHFDHPDFGKNPYTLLFDRFDNCYAGNQNGLFVKPVGKTKFIKIKLPFDNTPGAATTKIKELSNGSILASTRKGIYKIDPKIYSAKLLEFKDGKSRNYGWIFEDTIKNTLLINEKDKGLSIFKLKNEHYEFIQQIPFKSYIYDARFDTKNRQFWIISAEGLFKLQISEERYKLEKVNHLKGYSLKNIVIEEGKNDNHLWITSSKGIIKYTPKDSSHILFRKSSGFPNSEFNSWASFKTRQNKLCFGTVNGLVVFDPLEIEVDSSSTTPTITSILINDEQVKELKCDLTKSTNLARLKSINQPYYNNTISFHLAALDYIDPFSNQFRYRMLPKESDWVYSGVSNTARYANLALGRHTFEVDATNADGIWSNNPAQLRITIHPPWHKTWWAYTTYCLLSLLLLFSAYRFQLNQRLRAAEAYRLKELDRVKTTLYNNITHEFRTPLTVILGMADQIKRKPKKGLQEGVVMIKRSGQHLLGLVNQMLDLAKIESGNMQTDYVQGDIGAYCQYLVESYQSYAASKQINLVFYNEVGELIMDYDADKLQATITNLLSNATKFTPENGKIIVHLNKWIDKQDTSFCQLKIKDTGIGIAEKEVPHIFDRFYQANDKTTRSTGGTGIGLALTKELVELMEGTISVNSQLHKGTEFIITFPIHKNAPLAKEINDPQPLLRKENLSSEASIIDAERNHAQLTNIQEEKESLPLVLLIEDNLDILTYLQSCLENDYRVIMALNGQVGIDRAVEEIPDIIITDVMMPKKDGYEVCEILKQEERTSHIPIIMLTAKAHIDDKITGFSKGVDAYLSKPFHQEELEIRLSQLIAQRKKLQAYYSQQSLLATPAKVENPFLQKVIDLVESDLMADLDIPTLSKKMAMDRTTIYRKIKALTGESTTIYIRRIRLKNAHHLLTTTNLSVSEIAYGVGFKDLAFFSRSFSQIYGQSPSSIRIS